MRSATHQIHGMEVEEEDPVVTTTCLGVADGALNLAGEDIQHGVASTSTRAVAATTESEETPEKTVAEADATAASTTAAAMAAALEGRYGPRWLCFLHVGKVLLTIDYSTYYMVYGFMRYNIFLFPSLKVLNLEHYEDARACCIWIFVLLIVLFGSRSSMAMSHM
ncbi:hypothetical protein ZEAMMB73_Zm00001d042402 [Zea mays]|uniref:Uncharacterized protein n=1 Tax=Zea mays TaxID=4577 RepID=A0A1D6N3K0_MAIZE|nr:hypothetical protein ZEAMMB73_Zm00001d042402 [Zea mays]